MSYDEVPMTSNRPRQGDLEWWTIYKRTAGPSLQGEWSIPEQAFAALTIVLAAVWMLTTGAWLADMVNGHHQPGLRRMKTQLPDAMPRQFAHGFDAACDRIDHRQFAPERIGHNQLVGSIDEQHLARSERQSDGPCDRL